MITDYAIFVGAPIDQLQDLFVGGCLVGEPSKTVAKKWCGIAAVVNTEEQQWLADAPEATKLVGVWATQTEREAYQCRPVYAKDDTVAQLNWRLDNEKSEPKDNYARMKWYKDRTAALRMAFGQAQQRLQVMTAVLGAVDEAYVKEHPDAEVGIATRVVNEMQAANNPQQGELGVDQPEDGG